MSSRRKRAAPVRMDEADKNKLNWNMHEHRRTEGDFEDLEAFPEPSVSSLTDHVPIVSNAELLSHSSSLPAEKEEEPGCSVQDSSPDTTELNVPSVSTLDPGWKALIGEFELYPKVPLELADNTFCLQQTGDVLSLKLVTTNSEELTSCPVVCSFSGLSLEDLDWLQKRKVIQLCHLSGEGSLKLKLFLLESGLGRPEFLSEGNGRLRRANQLLQKLMELFYDFIIPEIMENEEEECDTDLERQNVEELYDYVRHVHQREKQKQSFDVQQPALIPVLRLYQSQAVNWMLKREGYKSESVQEQKLNFLWREVITMCGKKLFYNPYTGCLIQEFPLAGVDWPGGILADEMGLGKTVEVLALILCHTRQGLKQSTLTLPVGQSVNYYIPPPPLERQRITQCTVKPREKITYPAVRVMLLTAIKEMKVGKGASINAIFTYLRTMYKYNPLKNRCHIKKSLTKMIAEGLVEQVKGRGLAGSFKLGKNYREKKKKPVSPQKSGDAASRRTSRRCAGQEQETGINSDSEDTMCRLDPPVLTEESKQENDLQAKPEVPCDKPSIEASLENSQSPVSGGAEKAAVNCNVANAKTEPLESNTNSLRNSQSEPSPPVRASVVPFNTPDYRFECICGELGLVDYKARVQCMNCLLWQHAECVNYKEENLSTTPFYCPHCLVAMTPVPTGATLIISPSSICHQWVEEINRHIRSASLRVLASNA